MPRKTSRIYPIDRSVIIRHFSLQTPYLRQAVEPKPRLDIPVHLIMRIQETYQLSIMITQVTHPCDQRPGATRRTLFKGYQTDNPQRTFEARQDQHVREAIIFWDD